MTHLSGKLTRKLVENLGAGRHGDGNGLYLVVDPSGARRWILRVVVKGQKNRKGAPLRTDFGLGGAEIIKLNQAREGALEYRRMAKTGLNPRFNAIRQIPTFEEISRHLQIHEDAIVPVEDAPAEQARRRKASRLASNLSSTACSCFVCSARFGVFFSPYFCGVFGYQPTL